MVGIEINDRGDMYDMHGEVEVAYPPGHVYIIAEHEPETSVLEYVSQCASRQGVMYYCIAGAYAGLWEKKLRKKLGVAAKPSPESGNGGKEEERTCRIRKAGPAKTAELVWSKDDPEGEEKTFERPVSPGQGPDISMIVCQNIHEMAEDITANYVGWDQPRIYGYYDDRSLAQKLRDEMDVCMKDYRKQICDTLEKMGTFEFNCFRKNFVISLGEEDVLLGQIGKEVRCATVDEALDLPVFNEWTLLRLWCRLQKQVRHWMR